uniref:RNA-binding protein 39 n=1 Tax=Anthurium amnicola TaxID=1678845 RepID=A0A1D1XJ94_9ARAE
MKEMYMNFSLGRARQYYKLPFMVHSVRDVRLIMDRNSRRSKGVGYIEFYDAMSVPMAIALSGQKLLGQTVMVKPSEAEKNLVQSNAATAGGVGGLIGPYSGGARRLYVGNLHLSMTEDQLRQVFEPFGPVELVQLPREPGSQQCKGYGFIQFARLEDARAAQSLNGQLDIAGRTIKVSAVSEQVGMQDVGTNAGDFDDDEGGGLGLDARSRALLMQKLDRSGITTSSLATPVVNNPALTTPTASVLGAPPVVAPLVQQPSVPGLVGLLSSSLPVAAAAVPQVDTIGVPSECLLLKNMFDPTAETEPDFDLDIKEDVRDECSKFGMVKHIFVEKNSAGFVYLRFDSVTSAMNAQHALHGRWFAGKMITATFMLPQNYNAKFPEGV